MVAEYMSELYQPAHNLWTRFSNDDFEAARQKTVWEDRIRRAWDSIKFAGFGDSPGDQVMSGSAVPLRVTVELGDLKPAEVRVEAVVGHIGINGHLEKTYTVLLAPIEENGDKVIFAGEFTAQHTGRVGYSVRISPNDFDEPLTRRCNALLKWVSD